MNYGQLKREVANLGFTDVDELLQLEDDSPGIISSCVNRAIEEISTSVAPIEAVYNIYQDGTDKEYLYYDMSRLTKDAFIEFAETPVMYGDTVYKKFSDYFIERGDVLVINGSIECNLKVFYIKSHTEFDEDTLDTAEIELPKKVHKLLPLLTAYYLWLDDDSTKATIYYNQYEIKKNIVLSKEPIKLTITDGGI